MENTPDNAASRGFSADLQNYSGTILNVDQSISNFLWKRHPLHSFCVFVLPICASFILAYLVLNALGPGVYTNKNSFTVVVLVFLIPFSIPIVSYSRVSSRMRNLFYTELATALGCTYSSTGVVPTNGRLFTFGNYRTVTNVLSGNYKNVALMLADYDYVTGSGKSRQDHFYTIGELTVSGTLPQVICIPKSWHSVLMDSWKPGEYEVLPLEGNFNSKFLVYVPKGQEIEGLQILEPDVMTKLMDGYDDFGFECTGSSVYLFTIGHMDENRESVISMYTLVQRFCDILLPELKTFSNVPATPTT